MTAIKRLISPLVLLLLFSGTSYALTMDAVIGFDGAAKSLARTPITVTLDNPGSSQIDGELQVTQSSGMNDQIPTCIQRITLPSNSIKRFTIYARFRNYGSVVVRLQSGMRTLAVRKLEPTFLDPSGTKLVVAVGQRTSKPFFLDGEQLSSKPIKPGVPHGMMPVAPSSIKVASISPDTLPDKFVAYAGVDMLLVPNLSVSSIDPRALDAIGSWVASGGTLVINGGADYRSLQNSFMNEMLPVVPEGAASLASDKLPVSPMVVTKSTLKSTKNYFTKKVSDIPIIVFRRYGAGTVVYLAFDYLSKPFKDWRGQTDFWKWIMQSVSKDTLLMPASTMSTEMNQNYYGGRYGSYYNQSSDLNLTKVAESNPAIQAPSFGIILGFLLIYLIVLVPVNYVYMKKRRILEKAWYSTLAIVVVFSLLAYGIGYTMRGGRFQMREAGVIVASDGERYALRITDASVFSPARRTYNLKVNDQNAVFEPTSMQSKSLNPSFYIDDNPGIENIQMAMWSSKSFEATSGFLMKGPIQPSLRYADSRIIGTIRNDSGIDLKNCRIIYNYSSAKIPDIKSGGTASVDTKLDQPLLVGSNIDKADLTKRMNILMDQTSTKGSSPIFTAAVDDSMGTFDLSNANGEVKRTNSLIMKFKLTSNDNKMLPVGAIKGKLLSYTGSVGQEMPGMQSIVTFYINQSGTATSLFKLPAGIDALSALIVNCKIHAENNYGSQKRKISLSVLNVKTGKWDAIGTGNGVRLEKSSDYIDNKHEIRIKTKLTAPTQGYTYINFSISLSGSL